MYYALVSGHSGLDHLADEIIGRAERRLGDTERTRRRMGAALRGAIGEMRRLMGPRSWPQIEVRA